MTTGGENAEHIQQAQHAEAEAKAEHADEEQVDQADDVQSPLNIEVHESEMEISRRNFLTKVGIALGSLSAALLAGPVLAFLVAPLFRKPPEIWRSVGKVSDFKVGETVEVTFEEASPLPWAGVTARTAAWLRRVSEREFIAFSVQCTHLGCPVSWLAGAKLFMCPCHGGVYYADGRVAAGPPPEPLPRYKVRIQNDEVQLLVSEVPEPPPSL
jgi:menaquinol-cytochrome c reductase iron-sulfur subunit